MNFPFIYYFHLYFAFFCENLVFFYTFTDRTENLKSEFKGQYMKTKKTRKKIDFFSKILNIS